MILFFFFLFFFYIWAWRFNGFKQRGAWPYGCRQLQLGENKGQTDQKFGFDGGEINSFSLAEAETTGADAIKAAVIIFKGTSDPSDWVWKSADLKSRLSPTSKESLHFAALSFYIFKVKHRM